MNRSGRAKAHRLPCGFTLVELLVVTLILSILMAVSLPTYLSAVADSQKKVCRANMQTIANTIQAAKIKTNGVDYSSFIGSVTTTLEQDLQGVPVCPNGGTYTVGFGISNNATTFKVSCSAAGHGMFRPGVDSN